MKITVLDANSLGRDVDLSILEVFGELKVFGYTTPDEVSSRISDTHVIITNKVILNEENLIEAKSLKQICLTATGSNNIDIGYANERGIRVCNVVGYSTASVVQHTFAMLFYVMEQLNYYNNYVKSETYIDDQAFKHFEHQFNELAGKTLGIIGLGRIGEKVADIATSFGAKVQYYSTSGSHVHPTYKRVGFEELLKTSDILSIHAPLNEATYHLIDEKAFLLMKETAILLNLGRGDIIVEADLAKAIEKDLIKAVALDVLSVEPMASNSPLRGVLNSDRLFITPHIGWASIESRNRVIQEIVKNIQAYLDGEERCIVTL